MSTSLQTQELVVNMGPQHPSTHGVYRAVITLNGETISRVESVIGYLHRGIEKIFENRTYPQIVPYTDRLDYLATNLSNWGYVLTVEKMLNVEVPERAEYIRVIMGELSRIASHLVFLGSYAIDLAATTGWMYAFRERERILDLFEMVTGSRMTTSYLRIGGVAEDLPPEFEPALKTFLGGLPEAFREYENLILGNEILRARSVGLGILSAEEGIAYGVTGPNLRASGVNYDLRKQEPYSIYDRFDFEVPLGSHGDCYDRLEVRLLEMKESAKLIEQALAGLPEGPVLAKVPRIVKPPAGEMYQAVESSKGELGFHIISDGTDKPYRMHVRAPSFINLTPLTEMVKGLKVQDFVTVLASIDLVMGEVDR